MSPRPGTEVPLSLLGAIRRRVLAVVTCWAYHSGHWWLARRPSSHTAASWGPGWYGTQPKWHTSSGPWLEPTCIDRKMVRDFIPTYIFRTRFFKDMNRKHNYLNHKLETALPKLRQALGWIGRFSDLHRVSPCRPAVMLEGTTIQGPKCSWSDSDSGHCRAPLRHGYLDGRLNCFHRDVYS